MKVVFGICFPRHPCSFQRPNHPSQIPKPPFQIQIMPGFFGSIVNNIYLCSQNI